MLNQKTKKSCVRIHYIICSFKKIYIGYRLITSLDYNHRKKKNSDLPKKLGCSCTHKTNNAYFFDNAYSQHNKLYGVYSQASINSSLDCILQ